MTRARWRLVAIGGAGLLAGLATLVYVFPWTIPRLVRIPLTWGLLPALIFNEISSLAGLGRPADAPLILFLVNWAGWAGSALMLLRHRRREAPWS